MRESSGSGGGERNRRRSTRRGSRRWSGRRGQGIHHLDVRAASPPLIASAPADPLARRVPPWPVDEERRPAGVHADGFAAVAIEDAHQLERRRSTGTGRGITGALVIALSFY